MTPGSLTFTVTREDILRSKVLDPGWYKVRIKNISQEPSNAGDSTNTWVEFNVLEGPAQKDQSNINDTPVRRCFSEKAPGFIIPFLQALGQKVGENGGNFDLSKAKGREILAYIQTRMYEGKPQNDVADFRSIG